MKKRLSVGLVGCGTIGTEIARACTKKLRSKVTLTAFFDTDQARVRGLEKLLAKKLGVTSAASVVKKCDLVIEAAHPSSVKALLTTVMKEKKSIMIMSVGGLIGNESVVGRAQQKGIKVYLPSGAIAGIDALKAARHARITSVTLTTRKPPQGLAGYVKTGGRSLKSSPDTVVFSGSAAKAVKMFPKNINVSALLSLAGRGSRKTRVRIVASPRLKRNVHEVEIKGDFGRICTQTENRPSPGNPRTSYLACLSAIATIEGIVNPLRIGT